MRIIISAIALIMGCCSLHAQETIRLKLQGKETFVFDTTRINITNTSDNIALGAQTLTKYAIDINNPIHGTKNIAIGTASLKNTTTGFSNVAIGHESMLANTIGWSNTALGYKSMSGKISGAHNTAIGEGAMEGNTSGSNNTALGDDAMLLNTGSRNTAVGQDALSAANGASGNVAIGYRAGAGATANNKLYIHNDSVGAGESLIYGEFDNQLIRINGELQIGQSYVLPISDGASGQVLQTNGLGTLGWGDKSSTTSLIEDADGDTKIEAKDFFFSDGIDISVDGVNYLKLAEKRIQFLNANDNVILSNVGTAISGSGNTFLGSGTASTNNIGSNNIFIGLNAGANEGGDARLYMDINSTNKPLLYGEFDNDVLRINGHGQAFNEETSRPAFLAQYTGTTFADVAGIKGVSKPGDGWGIGGEFEGGYIGIDAKVVPTSDNTYYGARINVTAEGFAQTSAATQYGVNSYTAGNGTNVGVSGHAQNGSNSTGVSGSATGAPINYGVHGTADGDPFNNPSLGAFYGVYGESFFGANTFGVYGEASQKGVYGKAISNPTSPFTYEKIGVYGEASGTGVNYGGYFVGNAAAVYASGDINYTGSLNNVSDQRVKKNINSIDSALEKVCLLQPKSYAFKQDEYSEMNLPGGKHYGFIAQEIRNILPDVVNENSMKKNDDTSSSLMSVNYLEIIPVLTKAIQEQQDIIESLIQRIEKLESK